MNSTQSPRTVIIIPAYNESRISEVVSRVIENYPKFDVVVINDGSTDQTAENAKKAGAKVLSHPNNMGYGVAIQTGYKYALKKKFDYLVQIDGDGQHDVHSVEVLLAPFVALDNGPDLVLGSRFLSDNQYKPSIARRLGFVFFRFLLNMITQKSFTDPTTGFQAMNQKMIHFFSNDFFPCDYPDADVIVLATKMGYKIQEVPVKMYFNGSEGSMHSGLFNKIYYIFKMILSMLMISIRRI